MALFKIFRSSSNLPETITDGYAYFLKNSSKFYIDHGTTRSCINPDNFGNIVVGNQTISADQLADTLTLVAGDDITITADTSTDTLTISSNAMPKSGGTFTGAVTLFGAPTQDLHAATKKYVDDAVATADAMVFRGTIGTNGTITTLPSSGVIVGDTYKVISNQTIPASKSYTETEISAKAGDLIVAMTTSTWIVVPSGDEDVTSIRYSALTSNVTTSAQTGDIILGEAATKQVAASVSATTDLPTASAVASYVDGKASSTNPVMDGTAAAGSASTFARADHVHPSDTTKVDKVEGKGLSTEDYTSEEKTKLSGIATGAEVNQNSFAAVKVGTTTVEADSATDTLTLKAGSNITLSATASSDEIEISATDTTYSVATSSTAGLMSETDKAKLDGIESGAEANVNADWNASSGDAKILNKPTLGSAAAKDVPTSGNASTSQVVMGDDSRLSDSRNAADVYAWAKSSSKPSYTASEVGAIASTSKGAVNGVAELDANGKVPTSQLPSYVDDVLEYATKSSFPSTGETGKIYVDTTTNLTYRWSGTAYVEISPSLALGETSSTAYRGDNGKTAYDHSQLVSGNPHGVTKSDVGLGNVGNFKAVSTVASQGLSSTEQANARANIGAGTGNGTITGITMNGSSKGTSGVVDLGTVITSHQDISGKANKSETVSTVAWDSTNKKLTKTINGTTSDIVTGATILGGLTKSQVTTALGYTPPTQDTTYESQSASSGGTAVSLVTTGEKYTWNNKSNFSGSYNDLSNKPTLGTAAAKDVASSGNASSTQVVMGNDSRLSDARNAADVYSWAKASSKPSYTASEVGAATSGHTHGLSLAADSGTSSISLAANTKYKLTAGGSTYVFTTPPDTDTNTWRPVGTGASDAAAGNHTHGISIATDTGTNQLSMAANTKYKITAGGQSYIFTTPADNNTTYESKAAASGGTAVSLVTTGEKYTWNNKTSNTGTVTKVATGTGLTGGDITTSGTVSLATVSTVTSGSYGPSANVSGSNGATISVPYITVDAYGRVTSIANKTYTSVDTDTNTHNTAYLYAGASNGTANASTTNGNTYLILMDGGSATTRRKISGSGATTVTSDASGNITISSTDNNTWRGISDSVSSSDSNTSASSKAVKTAYDLAAGKTSNTGTVTKVATGAGLAGGPITTSGTISLESGVITAGSAGPTANVVGNNNSTISVPRITVDTYGRVTGLTSYTLTCKNTDTDTWTTATGTTLGVVKGGSDTSNDIRISSGLIYVDDASCSSEIANIFAGTYS